MIVKIQITGLTLKVLGLASRTARASVWGFGPIISAFQCGNFSGSQELKSDHKTLGSKSCPPPCPRICEEVGFKMPRGHPCSHYGNVLWDLPVWTNHSLATHRALGLTIFLLLINYGCTLPAVQISKWNPCASYIPLRAKKKKMCHTVDSRKVFFFF